MLVNLLRTRTLVQRNKNPFATHIPVLIGLSLITNWKKIVEYGSGMLSTPTLANKNIFKDVTEVISYENNKEWYQHVNTSLFTNDYLSLRFVDGEMNKSVSVEEINNSDLVFIDDSSTCSERVKTIKKVIDCRPKCVLVHDFEVFRYRFAARGMANVYIFKSLIPNTGLLWNDLLINQKSVMVIDNVIKKNLNHIPLDDIEGWKDVLSIEMIR